MQRPAFGGCRTLNTIAPKERTPIRRVAWQQKYWSQQLEAVQVAFRRERGITRPVGVERCRVMGLMMACALQQREGWGHWNLRPRKSGGHQLDPPPARAGRSSRRWSSFRAGLAARQQSRSRRNAAAAPAPSPCTCTLAGEAGAQAVARVRCRMESADQGRSRCACSPGQAMPLDGRRRRHVPDARGFRLADDAQAPAVSRGRAGSHGNPQVLPVPWRMIFFVAPALDIYQQKIDAHGKVKQHSRGHR